MAWREDCGWKNWVCRNLEETRIAPHTPFVTTCMWEQIVCFELVSGDRRPNPTSFSWTRAQSFDQLVDSLESLVPGRLRMLCTTKFVVGSFEWISRFGWYIWKFPWKSLSFDLSCLSNLKTGPNSPPKMNSGIVCRIDGTAFSNWTRGVVAYGRLDCSWTVRLQNRLKKAKKVNERANGRRLVCVFAKQCSAVVLLP